MKKKTWRYHAIVCMAVCLMIFCAMTAKEADKTAIMQNKWTEGTKMPEEKVNVSAEHEQASVKVTANSDVSPKYAPTLAEREEALAVNDEGIATHAETLAEGSKLHTQGLTETTDAIGLPTRSVVRGFGWQEENGTWRYHSGVDIAYAQGEQVRIVRGGTVHRVEQVAGGYAVEVKSGKDLWRYEPLADVSASVGARIGAGAAIGVMQENMTLHIGRQHDGVWTDPMSMQN